MRYIDADSVDEVTKKQKNFGPRCDSLFQKLNIKMYGANAVALTPTQLNAKRLELKKMARAIKESVIDEDYPDQDKSWSDVSPMDQHYYMLLLEEKAAKVSMNIFHCKNMWCARNVFQEIIKGNKQTVNRRNKRVSEIYKYTVY